MSNVWELTKVEFFVTNSTIKQHGSINFFSSLPRWPLSKSKYSSVTSYVLHTCVSGAIPLIVGVLIAFCLMVAMISRFTCLSGFIDRRKEIRRRRKPALNLKHAIIVSAATAFVMILTGIGILGTLIVAEASLNIVSSMDGILRDVRVTGLSIMDLLLWMKEQLIHFDTSEFDANSKEEELLFSAFSTLIAYGEPRLPNMMPLRDAVSDLLGSIISLIDMTGKAVIFLFSIMMVVFAICLLVPFFTGVCGVGKRRTKACGIALLTLYIFVPLLLSWIFLGLWTMIGIVISDGCDLSHGYRDVLLFSNSSVVKNNPLVDTGIICSKSLSNSEAMVDKAIGTFLNNPLAVSTATTLLNITSEDLTETILWGTGQIKPYINCEILKGYSGKLETLACGDRQTSLVAGLQYIWFSFMLLSVVLSASFISLCFGSHEAWRSMTI